MDASLKPLSELITKRPKPAGPSKPTSLVAGIELKTLPRVSHTGDAHPSHQWGADEAPTLDLELLANALIKKTPLRVALKYVMDTFGQRMPDAALSLHKVEGKALKMIAAEGIHASLAALLNTIRAENDFGWMLDHASKHQEATQEAQLWNRHPALSLDLEFITAVVLQPFETGNKERFCLMAWCAEEAELDALEAQIMSATKLAQIFLDDARSRYFSNEIAAQSQGLRISPGQAFRQLLSAEGMGA